MANSADPDQLVSSEANWFGSTLFAKAWCIRVHQDKGKWNLSSGNSNLNLANFDREELAKSIKKQSKKKRQE